jgi:hypothetical protein
MAATRLDRAKLIFLVEAPLVGAKVEDWLIWTPSMMDCHHEWRERRVSKNQTLVNLEAV